MATDRFKRAMKKRPPGRRKNPKADNDWHMPSLKEIFDAITNALADVRLLLFVGLLASLLLYLPREWIPDAPRSLIAQNENWIWFPGIMAWTGLAVRLLLAVHTFFPVQVWVVHWIELQRSKRRFRDYITHMTPKEREIIAYLIAKNQKTFTAAADGGHARTLLSRGIVMIVARDGQRLDPENVPMTIPDHLWDVLQEHKHEFPYKPPEDDETEAYPWRVHWMER